MNQAKAQELIKQLEHHQQEQIRCLQALFSGATEVEGKDGSTTTSKPEEVNKGSTDKTGDSTVGPALKPSTLDARSEGEIIRIPDDWSLPWSNALLRQRIEEREREPGCGGGMRRELSDVNLTDTATKFIVNNALRDLARFTFDRDGQSSKISSEFGHLAFYVIDTDQNRHITLDTRICCDKDANSSEKIEMLQSLFRQRTPERSLGRAIVINAFTPSALSAVLLCAPQNDGHDHAPIYAALRRHLSNSHTDRHYNEGHSYRCRVNDEKTEHRAMIAFTVPYFSLTDQPPATDCAPLSPSGIFGISKAKGKYIREEKFTMSWSGGSMPNQASLMVVLNPLEEYKEDRAKKYPNVRFIGGSPNVSWLRDNFFRIAHRWESVLDSLDEQTTLSSSITFNNEVRQGILFEDHNFTNSKKYFWALQSLRLFAEHIEGTIRSIPNIFISTALYLDRAEDREEARRGIKEYEEKFETLRNRVERKRQEIQSLSDGLFSASSVAESRLASEQNGNIRLLTLVTIAYLPLTLATSIYSMDALPSDAGLVSYFVVTILMCVITYTLVFYLPSIKEASSRSHGKMREILHTRKRKATEHRVKDYQTSDLAAKEADTMA